MIVHDQKAVSYTHLDVYKRQALPDGPIVVLDAVASVVLQVALDVSADDVTSEVESAYGKVPTEVDAAVSECLSGLERARLRRV